MIVYAYLYEHMCKCSSIFSFSYLQFVLATSQMVSTFVRKGWLDRQVRSVKVTFEIAAMSVRYASGWRTTFEIVGVIGSLPGSLRRVMWVARSTNSLLTAPLFSQFFWSCSASILAQERRFLSKVIVLLPPLKFSRNRSWCRGSTGNRGPSWRA